MTTTKEESMRDETQPFLVVTDGEGPTYFDSRQGAEDHAVEASEDHPGVDFHIYERVVTVTVHPLPHTFKFPDGREVVQTQPLHAPR